MFSQTTTLFWISSLLLSPPPGGEITLYHQLFQTGEQFVAQGEWDAARDVFLELSQIPASTGNFGPAVEALRTNAQVFLEICNDHLGMPTEPEYFEPHPMLPKCGCCVGHTEPSHQVFHTPKTTRQFFSAGEIFPHLLKPIPRLNPNHWSKTTQILVLNILISAGIVFAGSCYLFRKPILTRLGVAENQISKPAGPVK